MGISKVEINNADGTKNVLVDLTDDTVTADTLADGVTAHGANGELVTGTMQAGIDTSDATATADDIRKDKTAYINGKLVTGSVSASESLINLLANNSIYSNEGTASYLASNGTSGTSSPDRIVITWKTTANKMVLGSTSLNGTVKAAAKATQFGDATAEDVAAGKTFTSVAGLKVTGTAEPMVSNDNCEAYQITSASTALNFKRTDGTIKVWGYGYKSSGTYQKTIYAFCGDGYYTGTSYGTPSKKSVTWSFNTDGTLSGLPSGLTALDVLVTKGV